MLVILLWGRNCRFSSYLGCLGWKANIFTEISLNKTSVCALEYGLSHARISLLLIEV